MRVPTADDIDRHTDELYDRWAEAQPEKNLFLDPMVSWPFPAGRSSSDRDAVTAEERDLQAEQTPASEWK